MEPFLSMSSAALHCDEDAEEVASSGASGAAWETTPPPSPPPPPPPPRFSASSFYDDAHCPLADLLSAELHHAPRPDYLSRLRDGALDPAARSAAIDWILQVQAFHRLRPMTGFLAVNYLDRFLSSQELPGVGWPWRLLAVACLSVAAKMEETDPPPLLDLQAPEPTFVFESQTVARMELLLMAALGWRMRPVTPFDFAAHFAGLLGAPRREAAALFSRVFELLLGTQRVVEFLGYRPSAIAAAAVLCFAGDGGGDDDLCSRLHGVVSQDAVDGCRRLMEQCLRDAWRLSGRLKSAPALSEPLAPAPPRSPVGVLDAAACASCDTPKSGAEPAAKRRRLPESTGGGSVVGDDH